MHGIVYSRPLKFKELKEIAEKRGYQIKTLRMILKDLGISKEQFLGKHEKDSSYYLDHWYAWNNDKDFNMIIEGIINTSRISNSENFWYFIPYRFLLQNVVRTIVNREFREKILWKKF